MTPGEWIAFVGLLFTIVATGAGMVWFVGRQVVTLVLHLKELDIAVKANTHALEVEREERKEQFERVCSRLAETKE